MKNIIRTPETHPLTWRLRDEKQPVWLDEYSSKNGYECARKALTGLSPDEIVNQVKDAGLKGRGGAGFSTGLKWSLMPKDESMNIRYLLCNADEMEPGTYKDRLLMEQLPHLLVEGMIVNQVKDAGLKGRGGAGFSTGLKWSLMPKDESMNIRYLLCNADEMEPGTYKDRLLMEQLPHLLVEGMLISAFALKAYRGYIFLRGEYIERIYRSGSKSAPRHCRSH